MATLLAAATAILLAAGSPARDLVGTWASEGETFMVLHADGSGLMEGERVRWTASGGVLSVTTEDGSSDRVRYRVEGDTLALALGGGEVTLTRTGRSTFDPRKRAASGRSGRNRPRGCGAERGRRHRP